MPAVVEEDIRVADSRDEYFPGKARFHARRARPFADLQWVSRERRVIRPSRTVRVRLVVSRRTSKARRRPWTKAPPSHAWRHMSTDTAFGVASHRSVTMTIVALCARETALESSRTSLSASIVSCITIDPATARPWTQLSYAAGGSGILLVGADERCAAPAG